MRSSILITGHNKAYAPIAEITVPRMMEYAEQCDMDFHCYTKPLLDVEKGVYWTSICGIIERLVQGYKSVMYLDADQLITNFNFRHLCKDGFNVSRDWGYDSVNDLLFSMCGIVAFPDSLPLFEHVLADEPNWKGALFPEQDPMRAAVASGKTGVMAHIWPRKIFNCVPDEVCPGKVPEPWYRSDFAAHLTMLPVPVRVAMARVILAQL